MLAYVLSVEPRGKAHAEYFNDRVTVTAWREYDLSGIW